MEEQSCDECPCQQGPFAQVEGEVSLLQTAK